MPAPLSPSDTFPLWLFRRDGQLFWARGRTESEAVRILTRRPHREIVPIRELDIGDDRLYSSNHAPGWLHRPPYWLLLDLSLNPFNYGHAPPAARQRLL